VDVGDREIRLVELRGWLRAVDPVCKASDPAWYYLLEPDLIWSEASGFARRHSSHRQYRRPGRLEAGNLGLADRADLSSGSNSRLGRSKARKPAARGLAFPGFGGLSRRLLRIRSPAPSARGPPEPGRYVGHGIARFRRPHTTKATAGVWLVRNLGLALEPQHVIHAAENAWSEGGEEDPDNPARWTEIHPPDLIEPLPAQEPSETVIGVAISRPDAAVSGPAEPMEFSLAPPGPRLQAAGDLGLGHEELDRDRVDARRSPHVHAHIAQRPRSDSHRPEIRRGVDLCRAVSRRMESRRRFLAGRKGAAGLAARTRNEARAGVGAERADARPMIPFG
jgi:hypothetical protein